MNNSIRIEHDSIGPIEIPANALWGAQTQRSLINFAIGNDVVPYKLIYALAQIKQAAATVNHNLGVLDEYRKTLIIKAASEIAKGFHDNQFPLKVWQTGSGTQTNMNVNEVISNLASQLEGNSLGSHQPLHPNDHVNRSQSTNDVFPSAMHIATVCDIKKRLLPELSLLIETLDKKSEAWNKIIKIGRTHLQDAVPLTLGQEVSAWRDQLSTAHSRIEANLKELYTLPLGGTAVGTGLNTPRTFDIQIVTEVSKLFELPFISAQNKFSIMASHDALVNAMSQLKLLAVSLLKIVNDIRFLASGPRAGIGELLLPENEPGSSIMPGKINPTQCEAMAMVCTQVMGLDSAVAMAGSGGHLQMNAYKPLIGLNILKTIELLHDACLTCRKSMLEGMEPNREQIQKNLENSLMLVTALTPKIGYEKASKIAKLAHSKNITLRQASLQLGYISQADFDNIINPQAMTTPE